MKILLAILILSMISTSSFALEKGKTVTCQVSLSGGALRADADMEPVSVVLNIDNSDVQSGFINLFVSPKQKQRFDFVLNTGVAPGIDMITKVGGVEVKVSGDNSANIKIRNSYTSVIGCSFAN